jgi:hypothetical protein
MGMLLPQQSLRLAALSGLLCGGLSGGIGPPTLRLSQGRGRDTQCIEPPPPLDGDLSAHRLSNATAPSHLEYLALDGAIDPAESSWTNLGFIGPEKDGTVNETLLDEYIAEGFTMLCASLTHSSAVGRLLAALAVPLCTTWSVPRA